jgi:mannosyltransferase
MIGAASVSDASPVLSSPGIPARTRYVFDYRVIVAFAVILLLAAGLRLVQVRESLWLDELHTAWTVGDGWREIWWRAEFGNQSPLYFYLVALVTWAGGLDELTLRLPSALAGVALAGCSGWLVARWTGSRASGLLTALLVAVDRTSLFYAQEARPYAWVQLVGLVHVATFVVILTRPQPRWRAVWVVTAVLIYYLHYTAALLLAAEVAAYALLSVVPAWRPVYRFRHFAVDLSLIAIGVLPSIHQVSQIAARRDAWSVFIRRDVPASKILTVFPLEIYLILTAAIGIMGWAVRFVWSDARRLARGGRSVTTAEVFGGQSVCQSDVRSSCAIHGRLVVVLICWLFVPLIVAWMMTVCDVARLFFPRYLVISAVVPALLAGLILRCYPGWCSRLIGVIAVTSVLVWHGGLVPQMLRDGRAIGDRRQDWRGAVSLLQQRVAQQDVPVFVRSGLIEADRLRWESSARLSQYSLLPVSSIYRLDVPPENLFPLPCRWGGELTEPQLDRVTKAGQAWFLLAGSPRSIAGRSRLLAKSLTIDGAVIRSAEQHLFGDVALLHYTLAPPASDGPQPK